jgi:hypothetical protein
MDNFGGRNTIMSIHGSKKYHFTTILTLRSRSSVTWILSVWDPPSSVGRAFAEDANTVALQNDQLTIQSTLNLKKGDRVWVQIDRISPGAFLYDSGAHFTHFTGFMLEEEIVASLWDIFLKYKKMIVH